MFNFLKNQLRRIPKQFRQAVLWALVGISFFIGAEGLLEGKPVSGAIGAAVFIILILLHIWMLENPKDAQL